MLAVFWCLTRLFVLTAVMVVSSVMSESDFCASVFETQIDHVLVGNVINTSIVAEAVECHQKCLRNTSCKSFNVYPGADVTKHVCELNNKTRKMKPDDFIKKNGSAYYGSVKVSCVPVSHNKNKPTNSGQCHPGYEGKRCERIVMNQPAPRPFRSCKDIRDAGYAKGDGRYIIDPENNGNPLKVYCDMTTDGGGWLLVSNIVIGSTTPSQLPVKTSYRGITSDQMVLTKTAMNELRTNLSFTQLRFHCSKNNGRTFHVSTVANSTGEAVVQYFSGQTDVQPASCGSYVRMEKDNSYLAGVCKSWENSGRGGFGVNEDRLYNHVAYVPSLYHWISGPSRWECDVSVVGVTGGDFWKIYVR